MHLQSEPPSPQPAIIPVGTLLGLEGAGKTRWVSGAYFAAPGLLVVTFDQDRYPELRLLHRSREQLEGEYGAERIGAATHGWLTSDMRLALVQPSGALVTWEYNPAAVDQAVELLLARSERQDREAVAA